MAAGATKGQPGWLQRCKAAIPYQAVFSNSGAQPTPLPGAACPSLTLTCTTAAWGPFAGLKKRLENQPPIRKPLLLWGPFTLAPPRPLQHLACGALLRLRHDLPGVLEELPELPGQTPLVVSAALG